MCRSIGIVLILLGIGFLRLGYKKHAMDFKSYDTISTIRRYYGGILLIVAGILLIFNLAEFC